MSHQTSSERRIVKFNDTKITRCIKDQLKNQYFCHHRYFNQLRSRISMDLEIPFMLMAVFILEDALSVWKNLGTHSLFVWLFVSSVKTGTRRIIRLDELSSVVRLQRCATEDSSSRRIMRLVPVFTLETNNQTNNECLPKFVQTDNTSCSIKTTSVLLRGNRFWLVWLIFFHTHDYRIRKTSAVVFAGLFQLQLLKKPRNNNSQESLRLKQGQQSFFFFQ